MYPLSASALLQIWEDAYAWPHVSKALRLLGAVYPDEPFDALARLPIGERDRRLLQLRARIFGDRMDCLVTCPACGEMLELEISVASLLASGESGAPDTRDAEVLRQVFTDDGFEVEIRAMTSDDLMVAVGSAEGSTGPAMLVTRCIVEARKDGTPITAAELPETIVNALSDRFEALDPHANIKLDLVCPQCSHHWQSPFDIVSYLWREIDDWARRTMRDVHTLASAYGWREFDILAMSAGRRRGYINLIHG